MEKSLRVLGGGEGHAHSHDHRDAVPEESISSAVEPNSVGDSLRSRRKVNEEQHDEKHPQSEEEKRHISGPSKLSAYLNLFGDFVHNM
jgi:zinc transporter 7